MKTTIKTTMILAALCLAGSAFGQGLGIHTGLNLSRLNFEDAQTGAEIKNLPGVSLGLVYNASLGKKMAFETGLIINQRGYSSSFESGQNSASAKLNLWYASAPLVFKKYFGVQDNRVFVEFGSTVGFGLFGNSKTVTTRNGETTESKDELDWNDDNINRFDAGVQLGLGYSFGKFEVGTSYYYGLISVDNEGMNSGLFNRTLDLNVSYFFGR
jgi:hypothetical protein